MLKPKMTLRLLSYWRARLHAIRKKGIWDAEPDLVAVAPIIKIVFYDNPAVTSACDMMVACGKEKYPGLWHGYRVARGLSEMQRALADIEQTILDNEYAGRRGIS